MGCMPAAVPNVLAEHDAAVAAGSIAAASTPAPIDDLRSTTLSAVALRTRDWTGSVHLHCTDVDGEWLVVGEPGRRPVVTREHAKGACALRGPAADLLLVLWRRVGLRPASTSSATPTSRPASSPPPSCRDQLDAAAGRRRAGGRSSTQLALRRLADLGAWSSRSAVAPTRRSSPPSPTTCSGRRAHAVTAVSPSLAGDEEADCRALAAEWGLRWTPVVTDEMERAAYRINDTDRCYHCKAELMDVVGPIAAAEGATVVLGVNVDDLGDHRPGQRAADRARRRVPAGRGRLHQGRRPRRVAAARAAHWDKPAAACLASRIPYGTEVTVGLLSQVDRAEAALHAPRLRASCGCATTATRPASRSPPPTSHAPSSAATRSSARVQGGRLPLRHARPRGLPIRQPQRSTSAPDREPLGGAMKLSMMINYVGGFQASVERWSRPGEGRARQVWIAEAYSFDAISQVGYLAAKTETGRDRHGIVNVYSRTAALMAMTAAGCDYVSDGRFVLGLGASGPQVIEGFHGVPYEKPMQRIKEYIEACRMMWKREEPFEYHGQTVQVPLPAGQGTGLGKALKIINHPVRPTSRSGGRA